MKIGPYQIKRQLDHKGTSAVYEAISERSNRVVALKVLHLDPEENGDVQWQEAEHWYRVMNAVAELANPPRTHPHLVRVTDVQTFAETSEGTRHYAVMEFLSGESLQERLEQPGQVSLEQIVKFALQLASALDSLHAAGVAHLAISARNVFFDRPRSSVLKIMGFSMNSTLLNEKPEAAVVDRCAMAHLIKDAIATIHQSSALNAEAKQVLLRALDPVTCYPTAIAFARAFEVALAGGDSTPSVKPKENEVGVHTRSTGRETPNQKPPKPFWRMMFSLITLLSLGPVYAQQSLSSLF